MNAAALVEAREPPAWAQGPGLKVCAAALGNQVSLEASEATTQRRRCQHQRAHRPSRRQRAGLKQAVSFCGGRQPKAAAACSGIRSLCFHALTALVAVPSPLAERQSNIRGDWDKETYPAMIDTSVSGAARAPFISGPGSSSSALGFGGSGHNLFPESANRPSMERDLPAPSSEQTTDEHHHESHYKTEAGSNYLAAKRYAEQHGGQSSSSFPAFPAQGERGAAVEGQDRDVFGPVVHPSKKI
jgi:hypothetical protein